MLFIFLYYIKVCWGISQWIGKMSEKKIHSHLFYSAVQVLAVQHPSWQRPSAAACKSSRHSRNSVLESLWGKNPPWRCNRGKG